nr:MAG: hypothetical protein [Porcellio scaber clopovirus]
MPKNYHFFSRLVILVIIRWRTLDGFPVRIRNPTNYEHFNRSNFNIRYWSWNYQSCWHQTCPSNGSSPTFLHRTHFDFEASCLKANIRAKVTHTHTHTHTTMHTCIHTQTHT